MLEVLWGGGYGEDFWCFINKLVSQLGFLEEE